jgi:hypothetical protein
MPIELFISYSHKDELLREQMLSHLSLLRRQGIVSEWHDRRIGAGEDWKGAIDEHLNRAQMVLFLVSADFLASDYCFDLEMMRALERAERGEALVIPVIVRACDWASSPLGRYQALPRAGKPITSWTNLDEAWHDVAQGLRTAAEQMASLQASQRPAPRRVKIAMQLSDLEAAKRLGTQLYLLRQRGDLELSIAVPEPESAQASPYANFADSDVVVILLTQEFLNSPASTESAIADLTELSARRHFSILPVVLRECDWRASAFAVFSVLPHDGGAVENGFDDDERWQGVVRAIDLLVQSRRETRESSTTDVPPTSAHMMRSRRRAGGNASSGESANPAEPTGPITPSVSARVTDVYTTVGFPEVTFVVPTAMPQLMNELRVRARVLIVEGPSGIGKSVATEYALKQLAASGKQTWPQRWLRAKHRETDLQEILALPRLRVEEIVGHLVIDDFQMLTPTDRTRIGDFAKAFADECRHDGKITLVGINRTRASLIDSVPDLATRAVSVALGRDSDDKVIDLISKGEQALNVRFARKTEFALSANGSFVVAQMLCEHALLTSDIQETQSGVVSVEVAPSVVVRPVVDQLKNQFHKGLQSFALLDDDYDGVRGAPLSLLWHLGRDASGSVSIDDIRPQLGRLEGSLDFLLERVAGNANHDEGAPWHQLLSCDPTSGQLAFDDPKLAFFLKHLDWVRFAQACGVKIKRTIDGDIQFLDTGSVTSRVDIRSGGRGRDVRILHLSDLHFSDRTAWDAGTVLDRLAKDVEQISNSGKPLDLLIITGDIAFSGKQAEYGLARTWLVDRLLPAARLNPASLVIVPGNHDVDRAQVGRSAKALHRELLDARRQPDIAQALADPLDRAVLLSRHDAFVSFLNSIETSGRVWELPWGAVTVNVRGIRIHIAALCSSWLSGGDADHGSLLLSLLQVNEALQGADDADVVMTAVHHPWSYFADFDRVSQSEVIRSSSIVLRGHLHDMEVTSAMGPAHGGVIELAAGATYESSESTLSYNVLTIDLKTDKVFVHPRLWDVQRREWISNLNVFQRAEGEFRLRRKPDSMASSPTGSGPSL